MKFSLLLIIAIAFFACGKLNRDKDAVLYVPAQSAELSVIDNNLYYQNKAFSGVVYQLHENTIDTLLREQYTAGVLHGLSKKWHPNGQLMEIRYYERGEKHGQQTAYFENGNKKFEFTAQHDQYEGELKEWNVDGRLIHLATFKNGQEEGSQKMWYDNGKIRANYVMLNGKRYGLLGTKNCKNVSDSIFTDNR